VPVEGSCWPVGARSGRACSGEPGVSTKMLPSSYETTTSPVGRNAAFVADGVVGIAPQRCQDQWSRVGVVREVCFRGGRLGFGARLAAVDCCRARAVRRGPGVGGGRRRCSGSAATEREDSEERSAETSLPPEIAPVGHTQPSYAAGRRCPAHPAVRKRRCISVPPRGRCRSSLSPTKMVFHSAKFELRVRTAKLDYAGDTLGCRPPSLMPRRAKFRPRREKSGPGREGFTRN
jgi:hypothetical protein